MAAYHPATIEDLADRLERKASTTETFWTVLGVAAGLAGGWILGQGTEDSSLKVAALAAGVCVGGLLGYLVGESRAFSYRVTAQLALCVMNIEINTRPAERL